VPHARTLASQIANTASDHLIAVNKQRICARAESACKGQGSHESLHHPYARSNRSHVIKPDTALRCGKVREALAWRNDRLQSPANDVSAKGGGVGTDSEFDRIRLVIPAGHPPCLRSARSRGARFTFAGSAPAGAPPDFGAGLCSPESCESPYIAATA